VGHVYKSRGDVEQAQACYEESFQIFVDLEDAWTAAAVQVCLGRCAYDAGRYEEARMLLETALATHRRLRSRVQEAHALVCLGDLELRCGNDKAARDHFRQSLILLHATGSRTHSVRLLLVFARLAQQECRSQRAAGLLGAITAVMSDIGMKAISMEPAEREEHKQLIATTRAALGEELFSAHWTAGNAQSWEAAVAYALEAT
jgi:tetratricopeptide (TPR) repeat protein